MLRFIAKPFSRSRSDGLKSTLSTWHDPAAVPDAPIINDSRPFTHPRRVHWWCADTKSAPAASADVIAHECHFHPSASRMSLRSDDIPWIVPTTPSMAWPGQGPAIPVSRLNVGATTSNMLRSLSGGRPLSRVLTITRMEGESIRRRRRIQKRIAPEELVVGLGLILSGRAGSVGCHGEVVRKVEEERAEEAWKVVRTLPEEIEGSDEDW
ncbi:hypothetical protein DXG01_016377 [Tephrocybe rancida]|nr:hypothetical protein DXG01_016377 [Tephrocybe rancida]